ncbi:MAG: hypothetical protein K6L81_01950 [Agarilytica sp.]
MIESISVANGFSHELNGQVYRGRTAFSKEDDMPVVTILERPAFDSEPQYVGSADQRKTVWELIVQGFTAVEDHNNPTDRAYELLADIRLALSSVLSPHSPNYSFSHERLSKISIGSGHVLPPEPEKAMYHATCMLMLSFEFPEKISAPYA